MPGAQHDVDLTVKSNIRDADGLRRYEAESARLGNLKDKPPQANDAMRFVCHTLVKTKRFHGDKVVKRYEQTVLCAQLKP